MLLPVRRKSSQIKTPNSLVTKHITSFFIINFLYMGRNMFLSKIFGVLIWELFRRTGKKEHFSVMYLIFHDLYTMNNYKKGFDNKKWSMTLNINRTLRTTNCDACVSLNLRPKWIHASNFIKYLLVATL